MQTYTEVLRWAPQRYAAALFAGAAWLVVSGIPTDIIPNAYFIRYTPVYWWGYAIWGISSALVGLLAATYFRAPQRPDGANKNGIGGGLLSFFAVGCPTCNKLVLILLGSGGAMNYFAPIQPILGLLSIALLLYALRVRLRGERSCSV